MCDILDASQDWKKKHGVGIGVDLSHLILLISLPTAPLQQFHICVTHFNRSVAAPAAQHFVNTFASEKPSNRISRQQNNKVQWFITNNNHIIMGTQKSTSTQSSKSHKSRSSTSVATGSSSSNSKKCLNPQKQTSSRKPRQIGTLRRTASNAVILMESPDMILGNCPEMKF